METRRIVLLSLSFLHFFACVQAQWSTPFSDVWTAKSYFNPSFAGATEKIAVSGIVKYPWAGIDNAPKHFFLSANMPVDFLGMRHGIGFLSHTATVGKEQNNLLAVQYAFKRKIKGGTLNIAVQAGVWRLGFDASSLRIAIDSTKNNRKRIESNLTDRKTIDFNAGISWTKKDFYIGTAVMHINRPKFYAVNNSTVAGIVSSDSVLSRIPLSYNLIARYNIVPFHPLLEIQPVIFALMEPSGIHWQIALQTVYRKKYSIGISQRGKGGYSFFAGAVVREIEFGYTYDLHTSGIGKESGGSHEVGIRYRLPIELYRSKKMPGKSIRIL